LNAEEACLVQIENYFNEREDQLHALLDELEHGEFAVVVETPSIILTFGDALIWTPRED